MMAYKLQFASVLSQSDLLIEGTLLTLRLSAEAIVLGLAVGVLGALIRSDGPRPAAFLVRVYVEAIRNTPFLVQIFLVFFGLPAIGLRITANQAALLALVINLGAYSTEIVRAGIEAIPKAQIEAGLALSLTPLQVFRHIILIPALEKVYPSLTSQFTLTMLASSIVSSISAKELTNLAQVIDSETFRSFEVYLIVTAIYIALALIFRTGFWVTARLLFPHRQGRRMVAGGGMP
jgi:polar amino acid transport system permease protein